MATYRRGRNNKSELNLTSSFIAGGSLYKHHSGTLLGFYRFEEPYSVSNQSHLSSSANLRVEDSSGHDRYGLITSGTLHAQSAPSELHGSPVPHRTAITTPYTFNNPLKTSEVLGGADALIAVSPRDSNQLRVIDFTSGSSERIELPRQLARALTNEITSRPFPHRETYESGMTFAGWIKMHPVTGSFSVDVQAKASGIFFVRGQYKSYLHGETVIITDASSNTVTFTFDSSTSATTRAAGGSSYTVGIGALPGSISNTQVANTITDAINSARENGDLKIKATVGATETKSFGFERHGTTANKAKVTITVAGTINDGDFVQITDINGHIKKYVAKASSPTFANGEFLAGSNTSTVANDLKVVIGHYAPHVWTFDTSVSSNVITMTAGKAGSAGNTAITKSGNFTIAGAGTQPSTWPNSSGKSATVITTADKFTGGYDHGAPASYSMVGVSLTQDVGGEVGNTVVRGTVFGPENLGSTTGYPMPWDIHGVGVNSNVSKNTVTVSAVPANGETLTCTTKDLLGDPLTFVITFNNTSSATSWSGSKVYSSTSTFSANVNRNGRTTSQIASDIGVLFNTPSGDQLPYHTATVDGAVVTIVASHIFKNFDLTFTDGTSGDIAIVNTLSSMTGSLTGGAGVLTGGKSIVENKFIAKSIFTTITGAMEASTGSLNSSNDYPNRRFGGGPADNVDGGADTTGLSLRVISKPGTNKHNTLSWFANHYSGSSHVAESMEWRTSKSIPENVWTHIAVVYPTGSNLHEYAGGPLSHETSPIAPKIFVNGKRQSITQIPAKAAAKATFTIRKTPDADRGIEVFAEATGSISSRVFKYSSAALGGSSWRSKITSLVPTASIYFHSSSLASTATGKANHLAQWNVKIPGETIASLSSGENFVLDMYHTGSSNLASDLFEGSSSRLQRVSPNFSDLPRIHIRYDGLMGLSLNASSSNPTANDFIRITTPNLTTKIYQFQAGNFSTNAGQTSNTTTRQVSTLTALHSTASLSNHFEIGSKVRIGSVLTTVNAINTTGRALSTLMTGTTTSGLPNARSTHFRDERTGGSVAAGALMHNVPQGTPILLFAPETTGGSSASNFNSNRFIQCKEKFFDDAWVTFKVAMGQADGSQMDRIHANMRETPDGNEGVHVQVSVDGTTWYSPEFKSSDGTVTTLAAGGTYNASSAIALKHFVSGSGPQRISRTGNSNSYDNHTESEWKQYAFYCNYDRINANLDSSGGNGYYIRVIQRGYSSDSYDQWAFCDLTIQGTTSNIFTSQTTLGVPITTGDADSTWLNFMAAVTGTNGHGAEITATQNTTDNIITLTFNSPVGRLSSGVSAGLPLTASHNSATATAGLTYAFNPHTSVAIENFGTSGNETAYRIGLKGATTTRGLANIVSQSLGQVYYTSASKGAWFAGGETTTAYAEEGGAGHRGFGVGPYDPHYRMTANATGDATLAAPLQNSFFGSGSRAEGWEVYSWSALSGLMVPIGDIFTSGSTSATNLKKIAARTAEVINRSYTSGSLGVKAVGSGSLSPTLTLEQAVQGPTGPATMLQVVDENYKAVTGGSPWGHVTTGSGDSVSSEPYPSALAFSGGQRNFQAPRGPLVPSDLMYLGTPPQLLNLFAKNSYPYGFDFPDISKFSDYTHELGGRSPRAAFDDIAFWGRCLSEEEINALYSAKDGTFTPKSGFMSHPPRVTIRENDEMNHQYPTISRFGDKDFNGRYNLYYDATNEQIFHDPYAKAEILFKGRPRDGTWIELVDWAGRTRRFEFNYGKIVRKGNVEVAIHDQRFAADVAKKFIAVINAQSGFGISADVGSKKEAVVLKQSKAGTEGNTAIRNSRKHAKPKMRSKIRAIIPGSFTGGTTSPKVVFPYRLEEGHPIIRGSQPTPNAVTDMVVSGSAHKNILTSPIKHRWVDESITPYDESSAYAAFGSEVHSEADDFFTTDTGRDQEFYSTGTLPTLVGHGLHGPLWSKRKIEIDVAPKKNTTLHGHVVTGSTMAYFNFDKKAWEPIGYAGTGSYWKPQREKYSPDIGVLTGGFDESWSHLSSSLPQASVYSVSASSIDGEPASYSGFRQWLDKTYVGFSPSIGMMVAKSDGSVAAAQAPNANNQGKYVLVDGGLSTPVSTFGFPFHPKYHATSSQYLNASDYIDRPFLLEKIVYEFEAAIHQSCSIDIRTGGSGSVGTGSYGSAGSYNQHAYINSPTPSFFMLNQRMASLPEKIANKVDIVTVVDGEQRQQNFHYTASIPSRFYLAPPAATDQPEYVNTIRDLVTFGRFGVFSAGFDDQDFESYVPDPRDRLDAVITPRSSRQGKTESFLSASKLTLAMPARSPKVNNSITTFKSEGDFFGNVPATATFQINTRPADNDAFQLYDATGDVVTFRYNDATAKATPIAYDSNEWDIDIVGLTTTDDLKTIAARTYEAIARAARGEASDRHGNFTSGITLSSTGSTNALSFTISQVLGGDAGNRSNGMSRASGTPFALSNFSGGKNINDDIVLSWEGGRSGTGLMSGRSPFGGEYGAYDLAYTVNNNTQTYVVSQSAEDNLVSPYLLMPGDKLVFGWQTPIGTGSMVHHSIAETSGTFEIMKGVGKIVLYGSVLRDEREEFVNTSNQPLTSNALHEALHFGAEVFDQYDTDPPMFHSGTYLDNHVTGAMLRNIDKDSFGTAAHILSHRKVVSRRSDGNHALGPKSSTSRIYQKRSGFLRGVRATDARERWYDSMLPDVSDLLKIDRKRLFSPSFGTSGKVANAKGAALILGHPKVATGSSTTVGPNDQVWATWFGAFPFEPRYSGVTRTAGLKTKDVFAPSASGSVDTGTKQLTHIWLGNITGSITVPGLGGATFGSIAPNVNTVSTDMLNIIDHPGLLTDAKNQAGADGVHNPNFSAYAIVTNDHGHGKTGEHLDEIRFSNTYGNAVYGSFFETNANFFAKVIFGSGDGSYKFPKLPFWKSVGMSEVGYNANDTFAVTKGVIIRGFRYGLANVLPKFSSAVYRRDNFGHIRDMLEQRQFTRFFTEDGLEEGVVTVSFVERGTNGSQTAEPGSTNSSNLDTFCSSSMPYRDGHALDRISQQPDTAEKVSISIDVGLD